MDETLTPQVLAQLARPGAYPEDPSALGGVEWVQTHISHVFLTADRVYKFRKAVDLGFVCFATRAERNADCLRELSLNRRLAPDVYLGLAPLEIQGDRVRAGSVREKIAPGAEHCVVMRRLAPDRDALTLLVKDDLQPDQLDRVARRIAAFHARHGLGAPTPFSMKAWETRCTRPLEDSLAQLARAPVAVVDRVVLDRVRALATAFASQHAGCFERRRRAGRAVDAHGDLHLQHIWFETDHAEPLIIDCLEFSDELRHIDAAADVAFTSMDLEYRGEHALAERFLGVYATERDDFDLYRVVDYFACYRAVIRAKVAALAARDPSIEHGQRARAAVSAQRHLALADRLFAPRMGGRLVLVGGIVGTGKSTVAQALAHASGGVVISSDRVRKQLPDPALYTHAAKRRVYDALLERAQPVLESGRMVILDATWNRSAERAAAQLLAAKHGSPCVFIETRCRADITQERLALREREGTDPSDAGPAYHAVSVAEFEAFDEAVEGERHAVHTDAPRWERVVARLADFLTA